MHVGICNVATWFLICTLTEILVTLRGTNIFVISSVMLCPLILELISHLLWSYFQFSWYEINAVWWRWIYHCKYIELLSWWFLLQCAVLAFLMQLKHVCDGVYMKKFMQFYECWWYVPEAPFFSCMYLKIVINCHEVSELSTALLFTKKPFWVNLCDHIIYDIC